MLILMLWVLVAVLVVLFVLHIAQRYVVPAVTVDPKSQRLIMAIVAVVALIFLLGILYPQFAHHLQ